MTVLDTQITVGELVRERPARSRIFEELRIDYCCGGKIPLAEACAKHGLDVQQVRQRIEDLDASDARFVDADSMTLSELADHIVFTHHAYLREELPRLDFMTRKVAGVHGEAEPRLHEIRQVFEAFQEELRDHMMKEESILFPIIRELETGRADAGAHCGSIANPIAQMEREHDSAGDALERFRALSDGYSPPDWACNTFRALYDALATLEADMHQHVHKENNVLFPKAVELEWKMREAK